MIAKQALQQFQQDLDQALVVFEFDVYDFSELDSVTCKRDGNLHQKALALFFADYEQHAPQYIQDEKDSIQQHLKTVDDDYVESRLRQRLTELEVLIAHDLTLATSMPLDSVIELENSLIRARKQQYQTWFDHFIFAFFEPPYSSHIRHKDDQLRVLTQFCTFTGLSKHAEIYDWVGCGGYVSPDRSEWSSYFELGREWWGNWCLTVVNETQQTVAVIVASTTD